MTKLKAFWEWLKRYWKIPLFILAVVLGWLLFRRSRVKGTPLKQTQVELEALEAEGRVRAKEAELGAAKAREWVEANYQAEKAALNDAQLKQAEELRNDPAKLAAFLVRTGSGR